MKVLIIRFSSFGDVLHTMGVLEALPEHAAIHWVTKAEYAQVVAAHGRVRKVWQLGGAGKSKGVWALLSLALLLRREKFQLIYDAHSNLRSKIVRTILRPLGFVGLGAALRIRRKHRLRRLLLRYVRINTFPWPYHCVQHCRRPLVDMFPKAAEVPTAQKWQFPPFPPPDSLSEKSIVESIVLAPAAAWKIKMLSAQYWSSLIAAMPGEKFIILGGSGPNDDICRQIATANPGNVTNLAGKLSLLHSCQVVSKAKLVISVDTGLIHVADHLGVKGLCLMGPSAFGHPTGVSVKVLEERLYCRPCHHYGQGRCFNPIKKKCLKDLTSHRVAFAAQITLDTYTIADLSFKKIDLQKHLSLAIKFRCDATKESFGSDDDFRKTYGQQGERYIASLKTSDPRSSMAFHVWKNDQIIGQMELGIFREDSSWGYASLFYLVPSLRGKGYSKYLDQFATAFFRHYQGVQGAKLRIHPRNGRALAFYKKTGWVDRGMTKPADGLHLMEKVFQPHLPSNRFRGPHGHIHNADQVRKDGRRP